MILALLGDADRLLLVQVLLLVESPVIVVDLVHLAAAIFKMISIQPFTKAEDFLEGLLELRGVLIVGHQAPKQIIHMHAKHANQLRFHSKCMSLMRILIEGQKQAGIQRVLYDATLANLQDTLCGFLIPGTWGITKAIDGFHQLHQLSAVSLNPQDGFSIFGKAHPYLTRPISLEALALQEGCAHITCERLHAQHSCHCKDQSP